MTPDEFGDAVGLITIAIVRGLSSGNDHASERLELVAGHLLDTVRVFDAVDQEPRGWTSEAVRAVANILVKSEINWPGGVP